jgi:hypothetical protein
MEEMMEDTLEGLDDGEELEEEADAEVDKVLFELTDGKLGQMGSVSTELPVCHFRRSPRLDAVLTYGQTGSGGQGRGGSKQSGDGPHAESAREFTQRMIGFSFFLSFCSLTMYS